MRSLTAGTIALAWCSAASAASLPMDVPIVLGSVETVCTGIGDARNDPRWAAYPIRVEFSDAQARYIAGAHVVLSDAAGTTMAELDCSGSWVLLRMPRGLYSVAARVGTETATGRFQTPMTGQKRIVLRFASAP